MIFIPTRDTDLEWAERYTRGTFKQKEYNKMNSMEKRYYNEVMGYEEPYLLHCFQEEKNLSDEELEKAKHCTICDKERVNNWRRYCAKCEYYVEKI